MEPVVPTNVFASVNDRVFAISSAEVWTYFGERRLAADRRTGGGAPITDFGIAKGAFRSSGSLIREGFGGWHTRSAGYTDTQTSQVPTTGAVNGLLSVTSTTRAIRPAINVNIG